MKRFKIVLVLFLLLNFVFVPVANAAPLGTITGNYTYGDIKLKDVNASLYLIANVETTNGFSYTYLDDFKNFETDFGSLNTGELEQYTLELEKNIKDKSIKAVKTVKTDEDGEFNFSELNDGLYLISVEDLEDGDNTYKSSPSLVFIPAYDSITNENKYDVSINMKTELVVKEDNSNDFTTNNGNGASVKLPNTYDTIWIYIGGFGISLVLLILLVLFLVYNKKKGNSDEKDKK